ncbi:hypothetical protein PFICI_11890 [Pestalotiopsis fici W106-1]|uniref:Uncharacterized protein n=1 Tax=Pestalotiopsis fici (strain W106-1 / CGMCC3.15140) TaxID=1229662 RepID=W3WRM0_PESFW|nr:uncharacterized protein PFICI_11890 [Pestalotiopsis fici W106-1]ETS76503.1 hypothetical protein PFICI_11890 [Pestalotiopsis fici W106-1]
MSLPHKDPAPTGPMASAFAVVPGFEFSENGDNVVDHHLILEDKLQPWKQSYVPDKKNSAVIEVKGVGTRLYCDQAGRGGF